MARETERITACSRTKGEASYADKLEISLSCGNTSVGQMCLLLSSEITQSSSKHMVKLGENRNAQRQAAAQLPCALILPVMTSEISHRY